MPQQHAANDYRVFLWTRYSAKGAPFARPVEALGRRTDSSCRWIVLFLHPISTACISDVSTRSGMEIAMEYYL